MAFNTKIAYQEMQFVLASDSCTSSWRKTARWPLTIMTNLDYLSRLTTELRNCSRNSRVHHELLMGLLTLNDLSYTIWRLGPAERNLVIVIM